MRLTPTALDGVFLVEGEPVEDERGSFVRLYCEDVFAAHGLAPVGVQTNLSVNPRRGTLRGLHYQVQPSAETKLVRCVTGRIFDVALDLRPGSPTHRRWIGLELDGRRPNALYLPRGVAHGFLTLADDTAVHYAMGACHTPALDRGVRWNDPAFAIAWPAEPVLMSRRDAAFPDFGA